jgi:hypothetical protein
VLSPEEVKRVLTMGDEPEGASDANAGLRLATQALRKRTRQIPIVTAIASRRCRAICLRYVHPARWMRPMRSSVGLFGGDPRDLHLRFTS